MDKTKQFAGSWAVILGGSGGFGLAALQKLTSHGMNIAVLYRETSITEKPLKQQLAKIAAENGVTILPFNINALEQSGRELFLKQFAAVAVHKHCVKLLLHSIARGNLKPLVTNETSNAQNANVLSTDDIQATSYAMSNSLLDWTRLLLNAELFNADARIVGLTSDGAHKYWESYAAVSIAKASLESLTKYMAVEFSRFGLKTNLIQAGVTETASLKRIPGSDKLIELAGANNPMGRITKPADVANVIYMLCTDEAFWINGSLIHVDGGEHCL
ncbi:SDR family oxidoreductase [Mucilaginibacter sp. FT3.2]|uniref:SDR family oxidoreductase n=1 Tax=Mucilaginibacter sp. FT3.2 TaxID=2723090 RepID=UPI00160C0A22|nr:SDR family oxidoreductase [Mucilaginibacter sp. FT3.2]MBB6232662.1 enoyl-[acyl-carrier-protein] reductase (NADH) [Mucilaginibacter sp. FT3.2]